MEEVARLFKDGGAYVILGLLVWILPAIIRSLLESKREDRIERVADRVADRELLREALVTFERIQTVTTDRLTDATRNQTDAINSKLDQVKVAVKDSCSFKPN